MFLGPCAFCICLLLRDVDWDGACVFDVTCMLQGDTSDGVAFRPERGRKRPFRKGLGKTNSCVNRKQRPRLWAVRLRHSTFHAHIIMRVGAHQHSFHAQSRAHLISPTSTWCLERGFQLSWGQGKHSWSTAWGHELVMPAGSTDSELLNLQKMYVQCSQQFVPTAVHRHIASSRCPSTEDSNDKGSRRKESLCTTPMRAP